MKPTTSQWLLSIATLIIGALFMRLYYQATWYVNDYKQCKANYRAIESIKEFKRSIK